MSVWLQELNWTDVRDYLEKKRVVLVPIGSTEQHGAHLPNGTDSMVAIQVSEDAARKGGFLVAPPIWYGWSPHHMAYPGTVTLRPETLVQVITEVCESLIWHGFTHIIIFNGHRAANLPPAEMAATRVRNTTGAYIGILDPYYAAEMKAREIRESEPGGVGHAAEMETSHLLHIRPHLVDMGKAVKNMPRIRRFHVSDPYVEGDRSLVPSTLEEFKKATEPSGVLGDPTVATAAKGKVYHEHLVDAVIQFVDEALEVKVQIRNSSPPF